MTAFLSYGTIIRSSIPSEQDNVHMSTHLPLYTVAKPSYHPLRLYLFDPLGICILRSPRIRWGRHSLTNPLAGGTIRWIREIREQIRITVRAEVVYFSEYTRQLTWTRWWVSLEILRIPFTH
jgi:hypothetical protein